MTSLTILLILGAVSLIALLAVRRKSSAPASPPPLSFEEAHQILVDHRFWPGQVHPAALPWIRAYGVAITFYTNGAPGIPVILVRGSPLVVVVPPEAPPDLAAYLRWIMGRPGPEIVSGW